MPASASGQAADLRYYIRMHALPLLLLLFHARVQRGPATRSVTPRGAIAAVRPLHVASIIPLHPASPRSIQRISALHSALSGSPLFRFPVRVSP